MALLLERRIGGNTLIHVKAMLCAESVIRDAQMGSISLINLVTHLTIDEFPSTLTKLSVFALLEREEGDPAKPSCSVELRLPNGQGEKVPLALDFGAGTQSQIIMVGQGLPIMAPGEIVATIRIDDAALASWTILVRSKSA